MKNIYISEVNEFVQLGETADEIVQQIEMHQSKMVMKEHLHKAIEQLVLATKAEHSEYHNKKLNKLSQKLVAFALEFENEINKDKQIVSLYQEIYGE